MDLCEKYFQLPESERPAFIMKHSTSLKPELMFKYINSLDVKKYYYMITFTLKPGITTPSESIEEYIKKQFTERPALGISEAHIVQELTKNGTPHWHVAVISTKHISKDRFNYYTQLYGNIDISKNHSQKISETLNYLSKSGTPTRLC